MIDVRQVGVFPGAPFELMVVEAEQPIAVTGPSYDGCVFVT